MLCFWDRDSRHRRRDFLQVGGLAGLGGLQLANLMQSKSDAASFSTPIVKDKAVIFLFLHGGPSQTETFDPKMTVPVGIQSATGGVTDIDSRHHVWRHISSALGVGR